MMRAGVCRALAGVLAGALVLTGCAGEKPPAASRLPQTTCFGAFTPADLAPLLGRGDEVKVESPADLKLTADRRGATCNIYVDGKSGVLVTAERQPLGQGFSWPLEQVNADPIPSVENGKVWDTGAAAGLSCKGAGDPFELELWLSGTVDDEKAGAPRPLLTGLMEKYADYAKRQTGCGT
ncbi:hypothetical protein AMK16_16805 [Streptomyces sp. CB00455]|uniref:hypothetical protein n=1 Tax=Streptomyces sp. CB00455 TaxID=1703927 RepID=UPI00093AACC5|nr:hypothetical protein [Streptomyces sp. CB00455]OKK19715.1 hypothetical protein AMK16_16805 [Streptomyces sp. CB00455]